MPQVARGELEQPRRQPFFLSLCALRSQPRHFFRHARFIAGGRDGSGDRSQVYISGDDVLDSSLCALGCQPRHFLSSRTFHRAWTRCRLPGTGSSVFKKNICRDWMQKDDGIMKHIFQIAEPVSVIVGDEYLYFLASITNNNYRGFIRAYDRARRHKVSSNAESNIRGAQTAASNAAMGASCARTRMQSCAVRHRHSSAVRKTRGATGNRETDETRQAEHHTSMSRTKRIQHRQKQ